MRGIRIAVVMVTLGMTAAVLATGSSAFSPSRRPGLS
jgi:hypothetical protein